jgi:ubiquinone/menaquinone biosynthesis C-methylase UbiE
LIDNGEDGLGAGRHYLARLPHGLARFQGDMDRLPFQDRQFDVAVFNASFHYSEDYHRTLAEVLRCARRPGYLVIMDTAFYPHAAAGEAMVKERQAAFIRKYGFASNSLRSGEYLTGEILKHLGQTFGLAWQRAEPWYGVQWALRPLKARLLRRRQPSKFFIFWTILPPDDLGTAAQSPRRQVSC